MRPDINQHCNQRARKRCGGQSHRHQPPPCPSSPSPSFLRLYRGWLQFLMRLHEEYSLPALPAFGQVRQHPLLFPRGSRALPEHTELVSVWMYPGLEIPAQSCPSLSEIGSPSDFCSNLHRLMSTSLGSLPRASPAARRLRPRALRVRSSSLRRRSVARFSLRLIVAS